jgi:ribA/ribD-fused uncharacterized protein
MVNLILYSREMSAELKTFYRGRNKNPKLFDYDDDGNLIEKNKEGEIIKTIPLPNYRLPTFEEYDEMEKKRMENIAILTKEFEDSRKELRAVLNNPDRLDSEVLRINRKVIEADAKLQNVRFPLHYVLKENGIEINQIDFDQPNEKRKYPFPIGIFQTRPFTLEEQYTRIGKLPEKPMITVAEANRALDSSVPVILFSEPETNDYGFLSLKWVVDIEFNNTRYNSAWQAIKAEIAKSFNDEANLSKIMLAESPDTIEYSVEDVPGDKDVNEIKWTDLTKKLLYDINLAKFNQYPELTVRLLDTKNAKLGAYEPDDNLIGIGISIDNIQAQNPINWSGQNLLGVALMDIRDKLRIDREVKAMSTLPEMNTTTGSAPKADTAPRVPRRRPKVASTIPILPTNTAV